MAERGRTERRCTQPRAAQTSRGGHHLDRSAEAGAESRIPSSAGCSAPGCRTPGRSPVVPAGSMCLRSIVSPTAYSHAPPSVTDAYARWSFLASGRSRRYTFVECVGDHDFTPRWKASSLANERSTCRRPVNRQLWRRTVRDSAAPVTSNNRCVERRRYSTTTEYLASRTAAKSLPVESVERDVFLFQNTSATPPGPAAPRH